MLLFVSCVQDRGLTPPVGGGGLGGVKPAPLQAMKTDSPGYDKYVEALLLFGDKNPRSWLMGDAKLREIDRFYREQGHRDVFRTELGLLEKSGETDRKAAGEARAELFRRGRILLLLKDFDLRTDDRGAPQAPDFRRWEESRKELERISVNNDGVDLLVDSLARRFLDSRCEVQYYFIRETFIRIGKPALDFLNLFVRELESRIGDAMINNRFERAVAQSMTVLALSGREGREVAVTYAASAKMPMRRAVAQAFGEAGDPADLDILQKLLWDDPAWEVRARAAESVGKIVTERSGLLLERALKNETDPAVQKAIIRSLVGVNDRRAMGDLVGLLERSADEDVRRWAVWALNAFRGGDRRENPDWWIEWWRKEGRKER